MTGVSGVGHPALHVTVRWSDQLETQLAVHPSSDLEHLQGTSALGDAAHVHHSVVAWRRRVIRRSWRYVRHEGVWSSEAALVRLLGQDQVQVAFGPALDALNDPGRRCAQQAGQPGSIDEGCCGVLVDVEHHGREAMTLTDDGKQELRVVEQHHVVCRTERA